MIFFLWVRHGVSAENFPEPSCFAMTPMNTVLRCGLAEVSGPRSRIFLCHWSLKLCG